mmetsp:Transcript_21845/g.54020  ORF Transcript_21845/g.54020 Transcript_21845/m.54020 type:complete len:113 (+) Transcript_21845:580-918(+)
MVALHLGACQSSSDIGGFHANLLKTTLLPVASHRTIMPNPTLVGRWMIPMCLLAADRHGRLTLLAQPLAIAIGTTYQPYGRTKNESRANQVLFVLIVPERTMMHLFQEQPNS